MCKHFYSPSLITEHHPLFSTQIIYSAQIKVGNYKTYKLIATGSSALPTVTKHTGVRKLKMHFMKPHISIQLK